MADTATTRNRFRKQEVGAKTNAWGADLNEDGGSDRLDESLDGVCSFSLSGSKTLTSTNFESDEARKRMIWVTGGTGGTVTIPAVEKHYITYNGSSGDLTITNGSNSVIVRPGNLVSVATDGTNVVGEPSLDFGSSLPMSSGTPSIPNHLVNKAYADGLVLSSSLPGQTGNTGKFITTDGTTASWSYVSLTAGVSGTLPVANGGTGITSFGSGVATLLGSFTSANLRAALTDETGTGAAVFATSPTLVTPALGTPSSGTLTNCTGLPVAGGGTGASTAAAARTNLGVSVGAIQFVIDGGGTTITTGVKGDIQIPFACTITSATLLADQSGSIVVNVWKDSYANFPPVVGDKITASAPPTISAATKSQDSTLTGWTTAVSAGDILRFNVDSVTTCQRVTLVLGITR